MTEATWGDGAKSPYLDWSMSSALENVVRGDSDVGEAANLEGVLRHDSGSIRRIDKHLF